MPPGVLIAMWAFVILTLAYALWRGDRLVRVVAVIYAATEAAVVVIENMRPVAEPPYLYANIPGLAALLALALHSPRNWLLLACAFHLIIVATHVGVGIDPRIEEPAYIYTLNAWLMLAYAALLWGAAKAHRGRRAAAAGGTATA